MKIVNEAILDEFRTPGPCELCGKQCRDREPHHYLAKGSGGGGRLDIRINLVAVGASVPHPLCKCHNLIHAGRLDRESVFIAIALREDLVAHDMEVVLHLARRLIDPTPAQLEVAIAELTPNQQAIARRELCSVPPG